MPSYRVITGLQYKGKEAVAGDIVSDVPQADVGWLVEQGHIEKVAAAKKAKAVDPEPVVEEAPAEEESGE